MAHKPLPEPSRLRQLLRYDPETGKLFWRERTPEDFPAGRRHSPAVAAGMFNRRYAGSEAFTAKMAYGHKQGVVEQVHMVAHRVVWAIVHGAWPAGQIDHIDGDPGNNRIANLRDVSAQVNQQNQRRPKNNRSGHMGVCWDSHHGKWRAAIGANGKLRTIGRFDSIEAAAEAYKAAALEAGYHPNHGRAA